jgi:hypothetical protein
MIGVCSRRQVDWITIVRGYRISVSQPSPRSGVLIKSATLSQFVHLRCSILSVPPMTLALHFEAIADVDERRLRVVQWAALTTFGPSKYPLR